MQDLDHYADLLDKSGDFRVLRRLKEENYFQHDTDVESRIAIFLDLETTGLRADFDEIIELAMVKFHYHPDGSITHISEVFDQLAEPSKGKIPPEITKLTGITDEMVAGKSIDKKEMRAFLSGAHVIIAHNAGFDRKFAEQFDSIFVDFPWACSHQQVSWSEEGFAGSKLEYLASNFGFFYDAHRAETDCRAGIEILRRRLPVSGELVMKVLLDKARLPNYRIWAIHAPFEMKEELKTRGYRWNDGNDGNPKSWHIDVEEADLKPELRHLKTHIYGKLHVEPHVTKINAFSRFSNRI